MVALMAFTSSSTDSLLWWRGVNIQFPRWVIIGFPLTDRMLVAQAQVERLVLLSRDPQVAQYDVEVVW